MAAYFNILCLCVSTLAPSWMPPTFPIAGTPSCQDAAWWRGAQNCQNPGSFATWVATAATLPELDENRQKTWSTCRLKPKTRVAVRFSLETIHIDMSKIKTPMKESSKKTLSKIGGSERFLFPVFSNFGCLVSRHRYGTHILAIY